MPLGSDYAMLNSGTARTLEVIGERWTLLIIRDLFYGVRRFNDFRKHVGVPSAILSDRLRHLITEGVVEREPGASGKSEYVLTPKGERLFPIIVGLGQWGNEHYVDEPGRTILSHLLCGRDLALAGLCSYCRVVPEANDVLVRKPESAAPDMFNDALRRPHRLLRPLYA
jgi:DNA-binding HxlR family transcriptional regulator